MWSYENVGVGKGILFRGIRGKIGNGDFGISLLDKAQKPILEVNSDIENLQYVVKMPKVEDGRLHKSHKAKLVENFLIFFLMVNWLFLHYNIMHNIDINNYILGRRECKVRWWHQHHGCEFKSWSVFWDIHSHQRKKTFWHLGRWESVANNSKFLGWAAGWRPFYSGFLSWFNFFLKFLFR